MKTLDNIKVFLDKGIMSAGTAFYEEISTEENKDYRRGFRAGVYFAYLSMKADLEDIAGCESGSITG